MADKVEPSDAAEYVKQGALTADLDMGCLLHCICMFEKTTFYHLYYLIYTLSQEM